MVHGKGLDLKISTSTGKTKQSSPDAVINFTINNYLYYTGRCKMLFKKILKKNL